MHLLKSTASSIRAGRAVQMCKFENVQILKWMIDF